MSSPADEDLMIHVQNGNLARLGDLFERYQVPLFNFHLRMTGNRQVSEDLVQEVFLRVLRYRHTYQAHTPFAAWIYQIARNARLDYYRRRGSAAGGSVSDGSVARVEDLQDTQLGPEQAAGARQENELLQRALASLPEDKREVLVLARFHQLSYQQIGEMLGCETGTVKVRVFRAMQELRESYLRPRPGTVKKTVGSQS